MIRSFLAILPAVAVGLLAGQAAGQPASIDTRPAPWAIQTLGDFDGDGSADILWRHPRQGGSQSPYGDNVVYLMDGATVVQSGTINNIPNDNWFVLGAGDFTDDGKDDVLWRNLGNPANDLIYVYRMNGAGILGAEAFTTPGSSWLLPAVGDFDGDGGADLLWRHPSTPPVTRIQRLGYNGGIVVEDDQELDNAPGSGWQAVGTGDFDGDGDDDLLWRRTSDGRPRVTLLADQGGEITILSDQEIPTVSTAWNEVAVADVYGDGNADLLWRRTDNGLTWLYQMDGTQVIRTKRLFPRKFESADFDLGGLGDLDGDGDADVVWRDPVSGENFASLSRLPIRGVHFNPESVAGGGWIHHIEAQWMEDIVRAELTAIRERTGLTHVQVPFGTGQLLDFPVPKEEEVDKIAAFVNVVGEEGMRVVFNLGNHCQVPESVLLPDDPEAEWFHVASFAKDSVFTPHVNNTPCPPDPPPGTSASRCRGRCRDVPTPSSRGSAWWSSRRTGTRRSSTGWSRRSSITGRSPPSS